MSNVILSTALYMSMLAPVPFYFVVWQYPATWRALVRPRDPIEAFASAAYVGRTPPTAIGIGTLILTFSMRGANV